MIKRSNNIGKVFFSIFLVVSLTAAANDPFKKFKWTIGSSQDSSNIFDLIDPESILVTDPAYSAQDPVSELLTEPSYGAQDPESVKITTKIVGITYETTSKKEVITGTKPKDEINTNKEKSVSLDSAGNTVTKIFKVITKVTTILVTTTITTTTIRTTTYEDGSTSTKVTARNIVKNTIDKEVDREEVERGVISTKVTPNVKKTWFTTKESSGTSTKKPTVSTTSVDEEVQSMDEDGSTVIDTYRTFTGAITTPTVTTVKTTTTEYALWTDGNTTTSDITTSKDSPLTSIISTKVRKEHIGRKVIPNIVSTNDTKETNTEVFRGRPIVDSDCHIKKKGHRDGDKNIIRVSEICINTITTPITTVKTINTKRNTLWTDGNITSEIINTHKEESVVNDVTTSEIEKKLDEEEDQDRLEDRLEDYLNILKINSEELTDSEREKLANLICQKFKAQGFTLSARFYDKDHNWNKTSGFEKIYTLIEKCLRG
jgi:hypothetical protein